jgi:hypothetical protein
MEIFRESKVVIVPLFTYRAMTVDLSDCKRVFMGDGNFPKI